MPTPPPPPLTPAHGIDRRGFMLVLSSPSGAGKSSISRQLLADDNSLHLSVSATSRPRRPGEVEGKDYRFVDSGQFHLMINNGEFLEYAKVFGHYYGTPRDPVERLVAAGTVVLFDIDWQGTQQLKARAREDLVSVFILPPSVAELENRLMNRRQDSIETVAKRMAEAASEMSHYAEYDYIIINYNFAESVANIAAIITAERLKRDRQNGLTQFVKALREGY